MSSDDQGIKKTDGVQGDQQGLWLSSLHLNGMNCYSYTWYYMRVVPKSAGRTVLEYDTIARKEEDPAKVNEFIRFLKEVGIKVKLLISSNISLDDKLTETGSRPLGTDSEKFKKKQCICHRRTSFREIEWYFM